MPRKYTDSKERAKKSVESAARLREARLAKRRTGNPIGRPKKDAKYKKTQRNTEQQAALNKRMAQIRQQTALGDLKKWLEEPKQKNRPIYITEAARALNRKHNWFRLTIGCGTFAQTYLEMNPDCSEEVRLYYESMIAREQARADANLTLNINVPKAVGTGKFPGGKRKPPKKTVVAQKGFGALKVSGKKKK